MIRTVLMVLMGIFLLACEAKAPVAKVEYTSIKAANYNYHLRFSSDQPILELFAENKHQRVVLAELICSLDNDHNFDVEHRLKYFANGGIDFVEQARDARKAKYIFEGIVHFWEGSDSDNGSNQSLAKEELDVILRGKEKIPCKVRMTVYLSSPYYSETMFVPVRDILRVALPRQTQ